MSASVAGQVPDLIVHAVHPHHHHQAHAAAVASSDAHHGHGAGHHGAGHAIVGVHHLVRNGHTGHGRHASHANSNPTAPVVPAASSPASSDSTSTAMANPPADSSADTSVTTAALAAPSTAPPPATTAPAVTAAPTPAATTTTTTTTTSATTLADPQLLQLTLQPIDLKLLGLEVNLDAGTPAGSTTPSPVVVTVSSVPGDGALLGNLLTSAANLINLQGVSNALNNVLGSVVNLLNTTTLNVTGVNTSGSLGSTTTQTTTSILNLNVAPIHLNLLGAVVDTSPIHLAITAHSGPGLVLGDLLTDLANLLNTPPNNGKLTLDYLITQLGNLLNTVAAQLPGFVPPLAAASAPATTTGSEQVLNLTVPPIDLNLLGLILKTSPIQVNASATSGNSDLLGNLLTDLLNTLNATPDELSTLSNELNRLLGTVVNILNASSLLPLTSLASLSPTLLQLATTNLTGSPFPTTPSPVLNLDISTNDGTPAVDVSLMGLVVTTGNIQVQLLAQPGDNQILGNLVYNVSNLLNPGGSLGVLSVLNVLGL